MVRPLSVRRAASSSIAVLAVALAASSFVGCGSDSTIPSQAYVNAVLGPTADEDMTMPTACNFSPGTQIVEIGTLNNGTEYSSVPDQGTFDGAQVQVQCRVTPSGTGFAVNATAVRSGDVNGGTLNIQGTFTTSGTQSNITATFANGVDGNFSETGCTAQYTVQNMGVAKGRVWAELSCPDLVYPAGNNRTCAGTAEFRFENCAQ